MGDKVLAILRETMLHENAVEDLSFRPGTGELVLTLLQPDDRFQYPDHELRLTFSGLRSLTVDGDVGLGEDVLGITCEPAAGGYEAAVSVGDRGVPRWSLRLTFAGLRYRRSTRIPGLRPDRP